MNLARLSNVRRRVIQPGDRFRVLDFAAADHLERAAQWYTADGQNLVLLEALFRRHERSCQEQMDAFVAETRRCEDAAEMDQFAGGESNFFLQLTRGACDGLLAAIEFAGRNL